MKIFAQVMSVEPLALIVSLPNQLLAHVPITNITSQLTHLLESIDDEDQEVSSDDSDEEEEQPAQSRIPDLFELFQPGQYVRAVVTAVHAQGSTDVAGFSRTRDESHKASRRVELSLIPEKVNEGVAKADVKAGFVGFIHLHHRERCANRYTGLFGICKECRRSRLYPRSRHSRLFGGFPERRRSSRASSSRVVVASE